MFLSPFSHAGHWWILSEVRKERRGMTTHIHNHGTLALSFSEKPREACFDPGNIMNGTRIGTDFKLGSTVTYQCDSGYTIVDPSSIECVTGPDGKPSWDRALPACQGMSVSTSLLPSVKYFTLNIVSQSRSIMPRQGEGHSLRQLLLSP